MGTHDFSVFMSPILVFPWKSLSSILSGDGDGQLQVLLDEPPAGLTVAGLGLAAQPYLLLATEQTAFAYARLVGRKESRSFRLLSRVSRQLSSLWCVISAL
jgi:hypothetical protein